MSLISDSSPDDAVATALAETYAKLAQMRVARGEKVDDDFNTSLLTHYEAVIAGRFPEQLVPLCVGIYIILPLVKVLAPGRQLALARGEEVWTLDFNEREDTTLVRKSIHKMLQFVLHIAFDAEKGERPMAEQHRLLAQEGAGCDVSWSSVEYWFDTDMKELVFGDLRIPFIELHVPLKALGFDLGLKPHPKTGKTSMMLAWAIGLRSPF